VIGPNGEITRVRYWVSYAKLLGEKPKHSKERSGADDSADGSEDQHPSNVEHKSVQTDPFGVEDFSEGEVLRYLIKKIKSEDGPIAGYIRLLALKTSQQDADAQKYMDAADLVDALHEDKDGTMKRLLGELQQKLVGSRWRTLITFAEQNMQQNNTGDTLRNVARQAYSKTITELATELKSTKAQLRANVRS